MIKIAIKDLKIFFSDKRAVVLSLLLPIGLITLFALAFGGIVSSDDEGGNPITVLCSDYDQSAISGDIIAALDSIPGMQMVMLEKAEAIRLIQKGDEIAALVIDSGFTAALNNGEDLPLTLYFDQSREMEVGILQNLLISRLSAIKGSIDANKGVDRVMEKLFSQLPATVQDSVRQELTAGLREESKPEEIVSMSGVVGDEESNWGLIQAVAGTAIMMLLFSVGAIGKSMLEEKESGVLKKLLQSPIHPYAILFGKMLTGVIMGIFQLSVMFLYSWLVLGLDILIDIPALICMILATSLACAAFGVLLASIVTTKKQADSLGTILILFMSGIGGSMIPLYIMPTFMQNAAVISVNYWSIQGFYDIFWRKADFVDVLHNVLILIGIAAGILSVSLFFFKRNMLRIM